MKKATPEGFKWTELPAGWGWTDTLQCMTNLSWQESGSVSGNGTANTNDTDRGSDSAVVTSGDGDHRGYSDGEYHNDGMKELGDIRVNTVTVEMVFDKRNNSASYSGHKSGFAPLRVSGASSMLVFVVAFILLELEFSYYIIFCIGFDRWQK